MRVTSFLLGSGAALAAPRILPALSRMARPLAKSVIRGYLAVESSARNVASRVGEHWSELVAEARAEREAAAEERAEEQARTSGQVND